jgi:mono/diheme cytochrome c family protein
MKAEIWASITQANCKHEKQLKYTERVFDIINGFEIAAVRCNNCHKVIELTIKKLTTHQTRSLLL